SPTIYHGPRDPVAQQYYWHRFYSNQLPSTETLEDIYIMLTEHTGQWSETWKREGLQQGLQQGRQEGQAALLTRLAERRFGPLSATSRGRR
ncbi:hypothetical protein AAIH23_40085, partial [Pseudomonas aeruginosa]